LRKKYEREGERKSQREAAKQTNKEKNTLQAGRQKKVSED
jgi:hypothetical protein